MKARSTEFVYLYDRLPADLSENGMTLTDWDTHPEITRIINSTYSFYGSYRNRGQFRKKIKKRSWIKAKWQDGSWQYFKIRNVKKNLTTTSFTATHLGYEANRNFIQLSYTDRGNGKQIMANLKENLAFTQPFKYESDVSSYHQFTAKEVNPIDAIIGQNNGNQNLAGVSGGELDMDNYTLTLKERIGEDNGYRIDLGINLESIEEFVDDSSVINSLYLIGGVPDDSDYDGDQESITFAYLNVSGVTDDTRRIGKRENGDCKTVDDLKKWGQSLYDNDRIHEPKATHSVNMVALENTLEYGDLYHQIARLNFGDTAYVDLEQLDINVQERMIECVWIPTLQKYKSVVLGNDMGMYTNQVQTQTQSILKKLENRSDELLNAIVNATNWITGTKGGYVLLRPKNAPSEILIMDKPKASEAKKVWRWNLGGLGYSSTGVDGEYGTAITQDGSIVADYMNTGTLTAIKIKAVDISGSNITGTNIKGSQFISEKDGVEMIHDEAGISFYNHNTGQTEGNAWFRLSKDNVLNIGINYGSSGTALIGMSKDEMLIEHPKAVKIVTPNLTLNGQPITGGTGSGPGEYPPELTTQAEKWAWEIWTWCLANGYTEQAAAGILGNVQGEVGAGMNPDTEQLNGPAYGIVQWDGSAFPLVGAPTWDGREYVQRLMAAAGIADDYRTMMAQIKLVGWCMVEGRQWIGAVEPLTVAGYKACTDIAQATTAFERNFERPATTHPERIGYAQAWYDRLHGLSVGSSGWRNPVRSSYVVTQEWDQIGAETTVIHGGIDIASVPPGSMPDVFAARAGTVMSAGTGSIEGNYVMIDHNDGYYTYYGHFNSLSVTTGASVTAETKLGVMGQTGLATGVHLHFEVRKGGSTSAYRINPRDVINF